MASVKSGLGGPGQVRRVGRYEQGEEASANQGLLYPYAMRAPLEDKKFEPGINEEKGWQGRGDEASNKMMARCQI